MSKTSSKASSSSEQPVVESLLSRTLFVPVLFVSFIISLFLIDRNTSAGVFSHEDPKDPQKEKGRYYHANHRKLAKQELDEAFQFRGRVIAAMCITSAFGIVLTGWGLSQAWAYIVAKGHV